MSNSKLFFTILAILATLTTNCILEEVHSCTYTPDGQNFSNCYEIKNNDRETVEKSCNGFSGSVFTAESGCSTDGQLATCSGVNINSNGVELGSVTYILYSDQAQSYCESTLAGTYATLSSTQ